LIAQTRYSNHAVAEAVDERITKVEQGLLNLRKQHSLSPMSYTEAFNSLNELSSIASHDLQIRGPGNTITQVIDIRQITAGGSVTIGQNSN